MFFSWLVEDWRVVTVKLSMYSSMLYAKKPIAPRMLIITTTTHTGLLSLLWMNCWNKSVETNLIMNTFQYIGIHEGWYHHRMSPTVPLYYIIFSLMCCHKKFIPPTVSCQYVFDLYCVWPNPLGGQMVHASIYYITLHTND